MHYHLLELLAPSRQADPQNHRMLVGTIPFLCQSRSFHKHSTIWRSAFQEWGNYFQARIMCKWSASMSKVCLTTAASQLQVGLVGGLSQRSNGVLRARAIKAMPCVLKSDHVVICTRDQCRAQPNLQSVLQLSLGTTFNSY